jgi:hypothetical protein
LALISVAELLVDPDFVDAVTIIRSVQTVDSFGMAQASQTPMQIIASVQAAGSDALQILPDLERADGAIEVLTQTPLMVATDTTAADIVLWRGRQWMVRSVDFFDNFATGGAGHYEALASLMNLAQAPPGP